MGKLGKCPLMAALVMLVSFGKPVDVPNGQAGKKTGKDEMLQHIVESTRIEPFSPRIM